MIELDVVLSSGLNHVSQVVGRDRGRVSVMSSLLIKLELLVSTCGDLPRILPNNGLAAK